jgi:intracellular sulfur oxidation DsrE/DsrF family protein
VRVRSLLLAALLLATVAVPLRAQALGPSTTGPAIQGFGPVYHVESPDFATPMGEYKVVFAVAQGAEDPGELNSHIVSLARFLNMSTQAGVPRENLKLALVLHGTAAKDALGHAGYRDRFAIDNPNYDLLQALEGFGVQVILCGQSQMSRGLRRDELAPGVRVALSAMTALATLQNKGYIRVAF